MSNEIERVWCEFWEPIIKGDMEQVKKELYDYYVFMRQAAEVDRLVEYGIEDRLEQVDD